MSLLNAHRHISARRNLIVRVVRAAALGVTMIAAVSVHAVSTCIPPGAVSDLNYPLATSAANVGGRDTPGSQFTVNPNGTVNHSTTGLQWKLCNEGQSGTGCTGGAATPMSWSAALLAARNSSFAGFSDWRLPNRQELESLLDETCALPSINAVVFPNAIGDWTWTGTSSAVDPTKAILIDFGYGASLASIKSDSTIYARLVRSGQAYDSLPTTTPVPLLCNLDISGDGSVNHDTDGVLLLRYLLGVRGAALIAGVTIGAARGGAPGVASFIGNATQYDVFGRTVPAATAMLDATVLQRLMRTTSDSSLLQGIGVPAGAANTTAASVRAAVNTRCGTSY